MDKTLSLGNTTESPLSPDLCSSMEKLRVKISSVLKKSTYSTVVE